MGVFTGLVKLLMAAGMLWSVGYVWWKVRNIPGERGCLTVIGALAWTALALPVCLLLAIRGIVSIFA